MDEKVENLCEGYPRAYRMAPNPAKVFTPDNLSSPITPLL